MTTARRSTPPRRPARRTATDDYAVAADYASGMTVAAIAEKHRVGVTPLYRILDELGIERRQVHQPKLPAGQRRRSPPAAPSTGQQTSRSWRRTRLVEIDVDALISDYGNEELTVTAICETHQIGLTKLYQLLDRHRVERRRPNAPKIPLRRRRNILDDYLAGARVAEIARRHRVSESTVSLIAQREGVSRVRTRTREEIVDLAVAWLMGDDVERESLTVLQHVGCRLSDRGLRSIVTIEPAIQADVARQVAIAISNRYG